MTQGHTHDDDRVPTSVVEAVYLFSMRQGPLALIAVAALALLAHLYITRLDPMARDLRDHIMDSNRYQRQVCITTSILAGTATAYCDPPRGGSQDEK